MKMLAAAAVDRKQQIYCFKVTGCEPNVGLQKEENGSLEYSGVIDFKHYWQYKVDETISLKCYITGPIRGSELLETCPINH